jgi:type I restriction enzyme S subunit
MRIKDIADINQKVLSENTPKNFMFRYIDISSVDSNGNISESEPLYFGDAPSRARRVLRVNDIIISTVRTYLKAIAFISPNYKDYIASTGFAVLTPKKDVNPNYIYYGLINNDFIDEVSKNSIGVSYPAITSSELSSLSVPLPSLPVQRRIVSYLDSKTSEIDQAISLLERKREAYTRLKASVINRAVTRGLNPNVKIKDSGVEWIGKIPEGWKVRRIKDITSDVFMGKTPEYTLEDNENYILGQKNNQTDGITFEGIKFGTDDFFRSRASYEFLQYHDVLLNTLGGGSVGRVGLYDYEGPKHVITDGHLMILRCKEYDPRILYYFLYTKRREIEQMAIGSTNQAFFNVSDINILQVPVPPLPEQRSIASYLDAECSKIDRAASIVAKEIDAYKRLKRSLINEVVTGKRKVD